jgi:hypothetical protein
MAAPDDGGRLVTTIAGSTAQRDDLLRQQRLRIAHTSGWEEIPRAHIEHGRYNAVTDTRDGRTFGLVRGLIDAQFTPATAYYIAETGDPVFLEPRR